MTRFLVTIPGVSAVTNAKGEGGADQESDASLYARIHTLLSQPVASGNANHYKQWARSVAGVGHAAVIPLWNGNGTVKVVVASRDKGPLDDAIVEQAALYIESVRPIGAQVTVVSAQALPVGVEAVCSLESGTATQDVEAELSQRLDEMFQAMEVGGGELIRYNRVMSALLSCAGVVDCVSLLVNGESANLTLSTEQVPQLGAVSVSMG